MRYAQPLAGYRTGIEPVLLAASVPARAGERVIEAGTGAGAGLLCLAARVVGIEGIGVEIEPGLAALARANIAANGLAGLSVVTGDVTEVALPEADHAMANPPWHDRRSTVSPVAGRRMAKQESGAGIEGWVAALGRAVRTGGSVTMIVPPRLVARWAAASVGAGLRETVRHRLVPKVGRAAKLVLVRAVKPAPAGERGLGEGGANRGSDFTAEPSILAPALLRQRESEDIETVLHEEDGAFTPVAAAVLRDGAALVMGG